MEDFRFTDEQIRTLTILVIVVPGIVVGLWIVVGVFVPDVRHLARRIWRKIRRRRPHGRGSRRY